MSIGEKALTAITRCPQCGTRFRVSQAQLDTCQGTVRCGNCRTVFNAMQPGQENRPGPQLALSGVAVTSGAAATMNPDDFALAGQKNDLPARFHSALPRAAQSRMHLAWTMAALLMFILILAQAAYFFRAEFAAHLPRIKPVLLTYCQLINCTIPLLQDMNQLDIESSSLESSPKPAGILTLHATLRNRASYSQAYPDLELTLTNIQDEALASRIFSPVEYLEPGQDAERGISPDEEVVIKLYLDTGDLKTAGYRLYLS